MSMTVSEGRVRCACGHVRVWHRCPSGCEDGRCWIARCRCAQYQEGSMVDYRNGGEFDGKMQMP